MYNTTAHLACGQHLASSRQYTVLTSRESRVRLFQEMTRLHVVQSSRLSSGLDSLSVGSVKVDSIVTKVLSSASVVKVAVRTDDDIRPVVLVD